VSVFKYSAQDWDAIANLWLKGVSVTVIGEQLGIPKNSICRMVFQARQRGDERFAPRRLIKAAKPSRPAKPKVRKLKAPCLDAPQLGRGRAPGEHPDIFGLRPDECKWVVRSGKHRGEHYFCAAPRLPNRPYCAAHAAEAGPAATSTRHARFVLP
jgi:GcrA cell cycle regulator